MDLLPWRLAAVPETCHCKAPTDLTGQTTFESDIAKSATCAARDCVIGLSGLGYDQKGNGHRQAPLLRYTYYLGQVNPPVYEFINRGDCLPPASPQPLTPLCARLKSLPRFCVDDLILPETFTVNLQTSAGRTIGYRISMIILGPRS